jgi:hypothetical protein
MTHPAAGDGSIELARGRRAPYTQVGDWVALADVSRAAKALYWLLAAHVNPQRDDGGVWPSRRALAEALGYAKVESVDPLVKELTKLGAVDVERRRHANGAPAPNRYVVHETPPPGYQGPASLAEFYDRRRQSSRTRVPPSTGVPPATGVRVPRSTGGGVPPYTGHELDQEELDQEEPPPPAPSIPPARTDEGDSVVVDDATENLHPGAATAAVEPGADRVGTVADHLPSGTPVPSPAGDAEALTVVAGANWPTGQRPGAVERERLARAVRPCLDRGHPPAEVRKAMTSNLDGARNPVAVVVTRLRELAAAAPGPGNGSAEARPVQPHPYAGGANRRCATCGRAEHDTVSGRRVHPRTAGGSVRRCSHGRVAVNCPACTGRAPVLMSRGSSDATGRGCDGLVALDQALAEMRTANGGR